MNKKNLFIIPIFFVLLNSLSFTGEEIEFMAILIHYDIQAELFPSEHEITASATVTLTAKVNSISKVTLGYNKCFKMFSVFDENKNPLLFEEAEKEGYKYISVSLPLGKI